MLISQNRMQALADERANLDLQINLLSEHEVTHLIMLVDAMAEKMGITEAMDPEREELENDVLPQDVIVEMRRRIKDG